MCTCNSKLPFANRRTVTASSKSRAVSPSMVTIGQRPVITAVREFAGRNRPLKLLCLLQHFDRKLMRQVVFANDDLDIDAEVVFVAENLDHASLGIVRR